MIKLQFKLPQALISGGFTRRTVFHAPAFQQKGINLPHLTIASIRPTFPGINPDQEMRQCINKSYHAALITSENPELREVDLEPSYKRGCSNK